MNYYYYYYFLIRQLFIPIRRKKTEKHKGNFVYKTYMYVVYVLMYICIYIYLHTQYAFIDINRNSDL